MREFKIGDKVKIPSEPDSEWDFWSNSMDALCGEVLEVLEVFDIVYDGDVQLRTDSIIDHNALVRPEYLLTEPYNQNEQPMEIDLEKEQVFTEPKTRPKTHFETLKMVDAKVYFNSVTGVFTVWSSSYTIEEYTFCLGSDFQKAQSLEDVVWKPLTTEEP